MPSDPFRPLSAPDRIAIVKRRQRVFTGFLSVDEVVVSHSRYDGTTQEVVRQVLERGDSAAITLVDKQRRIVYLTEQFRFPTFEKGPGWLRELPAGEVRKEETALQAAMREAFEETGFAIAGPEFIATFYSSPGGTSERITLFFATVDGLTRDEAGAAALQDAGEDIALIAEPLDRFFDDCREGRVLDAKTLIAGLWLLAHRVRLNL